MARGVHVDTEDPRCIQPEDLLLHHARERRIPVLLDQRLGHLEAPERLDLPLRRTVPDRVGAPQLSLSRLNHWVPRAQAHPEVMQGTADLHHHIADALLPEADPIFHNATALHATVDMLDPEPTLMQGLVGEVLLPC